MKKFLRAFLSLTLILVVFSSTVSASAFTDISGRWYEQTVINSVEKGWTSGYPDGTFRGDNNITHAEFITLINSVFNINLQNNVNNPFTDVSEKDWYYNDVLISYSNKLIPINHRHDFESGYCDLCKNQFKDIDLFKPNDYITREDAMVIISRFTNFEFDPVDVIVPSDIYNVSDYAYMHVVKLTTYRIVKGDENGKVNPKNNLTRAEALTLIERTYNYLNDLLPDFIEPEFEIKKSKFGNWQIFILNPDDLYKYWYKVTYESPKELNQHQTTNVLDFSIEKYDLLTFPDISINELYPANKEMDIHVIDIWDFYYEYKGYVPETGEKITLKVTIYNPDKTISKDYYLDYIVK